jgi:Golgi phosphoprotein 3
MSTGLARRRGGAKKQSIGNDGEADFSLDKDITNLRIDDKPNDTKIGYDPRDADDKNSGYGTEPYLTLLEEVLLVGLKDKEGYLSFWNDNISYALRGLILIELALRNKIRMINDPARKRFELPDRLIEIVDPSLTGETLLDEALKLIKNDKENLSVLNWIDLLSGETWNLMKINYQLKQVRERLAKGLVDKGVLKTEHKNFLLFDMATHPINDPLPKKKITSKILNLVTSRNVILEYDEKYYPSTMDWKYLRSVILVCGCSAANVLENVLVDINFDLRDQAFIRADELLTTFNDYPFLDKPSTVNFGMNLLSEINKEIDQHNGYEMNLEVVAAVIDIFSKMDSVI